MDLWILKIVTKEQITIWGTLQTPKSKYKSLTLSKSSIFAHYPSLAYYTILSSIRDLIFKPYIDLLTVSACCACEVSVSGLGIWTSVVLQHVTESAVQHHHGGHTLRELYSQLSFFRSPPMWWGGSRRETGSRCQKKMGLCLRARD